jgi:hypothetical protein
VRLTVPWGNVELVREIQILTAVRNKDPQLAAIVLGHGPPVSNSETLANYGMPLAEKQELKTV